MKQDRATQFLCVCGFLGLIELVIFLGVGIKSSFAQAIPPPVQVNPPPAPPPLISILDGYYEANGEVKGKEYTSLVIIAKQGKAYVVIWVNGATPQSGVGILEEGRLIVGFAGEDGLRGVAIYDIKEKKLEGVWTTLPGDGNRYKETLTFIKGLKK